MSLLVFWVGPEDRDSMFLQNVGIYLQVQMVLQLRIPAWMITK
jgi:hypothetical protein